MNTKINATLLHTILEETPSSQNIMLLGKHGIGKSQILERFFTAQGAKVVPLFLGQMSDPGDLIGIPHKNEATGKTEFLPPYWFPLDGKPIVLFLDELNRARPEVLQTIMDLALNRKLAGRALPAGSRIISAVNAGDEYQLTELDPALVSRFNIYEFVPTAEEWLNWAQGHGIDERIISFIRKNPQELDGGTAAASENTLEKTPDRRGWGRVSDIISGKSTLGAAHKTIIAGIIGQKSANKFITELDKAKRLLSADELLLGDFEKAEKKLEEYTTPEYAAINDAIFIFLEKNGDAPQKAALMAKNLAAYYSYLEGYNERESLAHFANMISGNAYPNALAFIISECYELYSKVTAFVATLR